MALPSTSWGTAKEARLRPPGVLIPWHFFRRGTQTPGIVWNWDRNPPEVPWIYVLERRDGEKLKP